MRRLAALSAILLAACSAQRGTDRVFVSDEARSRVVVLDGLSGEVEGSFRTGGRPRGLALSPDKRTLYVASGLGNHIEAWDVATLLKQREIGSGSDPERMAVSADGKTIYAANEDAAAVSFVDVPSGQATRQVPVSPEPEGVGISPDGKLLVATSEVASVAHFIDPANGAVLASLPVGGRPRAVLFLEGGREVWVSSEQRGTISVFDAASRRLLHTIDLTAAFPDLDSVQAVEMHATRDGGRVFVAMGRGNRVAEIDPVTYRVARSFPTGERTWGFGLAPDDSRLYAASGLSGDVTIVDLARNAVTHTVRLGGKPWTALAVTR